jgi:hypothetical protein
MDDISSRIQLGLSAVLSAAVIAVLGITAVDPETAAAAGVVVEHRTFGSAAATGSRGDE